MIPALVWSAGKLYPMAVNPTIMSSYLPFLPSALRATAHSHGMPTVAQCVMPCSAAADSREAAEAAPFVEKLRKRGYEVLYLTEPIDEVAVSSLQVGIAWHLVVGPDLCQVLGRLPSLVGGLSSLLGQVYNRGYNRGSS